MLDPNTGKPADIMANADASIQVPDMWKHGAGYIPLAIPTNYIQSADVGIPGVWCQEARASMTFDLAC